MPIYGGHRGTHLLLPRIHGCWRRGSLPSWKCSRVRVGLTSELNCLSGSVFSILVDRLDIGCVDNEAEVGRASRLLSFEPQIRRGRQVRCGAIPL
jgi:hypothetical protein